MSRRFVPIILLSLFAVTAYWVSTLLHTELWSNLLEPAADLVAAGILFHSAAQTRTSCSYPIFLVFGIGISSWTIADILWTLCSFRQIDPRSITMIAVLYFVCTVSIFAASLIYALQKFSSMDSVQLLLDAVLISVSVLLLLWILVFDKRPSNISLLEQGNLLYTVSIMTDLVLLTGICIWYFAVRGEKTPIHLRIVTGSVFTYTLTDLCYFYLLTKKIYVPNSLIDVFYLASLFGIALGIRCYALTPVGELRDSSPLSDGYRKRGWLLLLAPALVLIFKGPNFVDLLIFVLIIFLYDRLSGYIQYANSNKKLLDQEIRLNSVLEERIAERTKDLENKNRELEYQTDHDYLTGLYNRRYFLHELEAEAGRLAADSKLVLILWSISHLKAINDTYGHATGDYLLTALSRRLRHLNGENSFVARFGSNEFAYIFRGEISREEIRQTAVKVMELCGLPIQFSPYQFEVSVNIGISVIPDDAGDSVTLLQNADVALNHARDQDFRKTISFYEEINKSEQRKHLIEAYLKQADYDREFTLFYQPQFRISDRSLIGMEALLRWSSPALGNVSPAEFIPVAEEANLIIPIGNWVIERAVRQIAEWNTRYRAEMRMGINISPRQLGQADIFEVFTQSLARHALPMKWLDIEITESMALAENLREIPLKDFFQSRGGSISIDDFGTGYASLGHLKTLSFDRIKIDKTLIDNIDHDETDLKLVSFIINLARSLGIRTIAEGVETERQFNVLLELGCDQIQGYFLGKPMSPQDFEARLLEKPADGAKP